MRESVENAPSDEENDDVSTHSAFLKSINIFYWNILLEYFIGIFYWNILLEYFTGIFYWNILLEYFVLCIYNFDTNVQNTAQYCCCILWP